MAGYPNDQSMAKGAIPVWIAGNSGSSVNPTPPTPVPATIAGSGSWASGIMPANGAKALAASATLSQAGSLTIQRYIDAAGTVPIGMPVVAVLSATVANTVAVNDGLPFASWQVTVANTSGSTGNLTGVVLLQTV